MEHIYKRYTYIILKIHNTSVYHMIFECMDSGALNPNCPVFLWGEDLLVQLEAQRKTDQTETERLRSHVEVGWEAEVVELEQQTHWNMPQKVPLKIFPKVVYCRVSFWGLYYLVKWELESILVVVSIFFLNFHPEIMGKWFQFDEHIFL